MSAAATDVGSLRRAKLFIGSKLPVPSPRRIDTLPAGPPLMFPEEPPPLFATARSRLPSPFRSAITTDADLYPTPTETLPADPKPPLPSPSKPHTVTEAFFA